MFESKKKKKTEPSDVRGMPDPMEEEMCISGPKPSQDDQMEGDICIYK